MRTVDDCCWGSYGAAVDEHLGRCEDALGRLRRSFAGEVAPDRFSFADTAHGLRDAAQALVDAVDDIEWWLGSCPAHPDCGGCAGHPGPRRPDSSEHRVLVEARAVCAELRRLTDRLAWGLLAVRADAGVAEPRTLAGELRSVAHRLWRTAASLEALRAQDAR